MRFGRTRTRPSSIRRSSCSDLAAGSTENEVSRRTERIANVIRNILAEAIQNRLSDPRIEPLTSITRVDVSPDFSIARVNVSVMAPPARQELCLRALQHASGRLRGAVAAGLTLRTVPRIIFHLDHSIQRGLETLRVIDSVVASRETGAGDETPADPDIHPTATDSEPGVASLADDHPGHPKEDR